MHIALPIAALAATLSLQAQATGPTALANRCTLQAYVSDNDPGGTNVRAAPDAGSRVVARLYRHAEEGEDYGAQISIVEMRDGWARIDRAWFADYGSGGKALFKGSGWVSARLIGIAANANALRNAPATDAPVILKLTGKGWGPDSVAISQLIDCRGDFAKIAVRTPDGHQATGWADHMCGNQVTTCP